MKVMFPMILGSINITKRAVSTHRDSYLLENLSVVSVRRPLLPSAAIIGGGLAGFAVAFADLLHAHELALLVSLLAVALIFGFQAGQLKLLSRDLRGSELSGAIWGQYGRLNQIRMQIVAAISQKDEGTPS